MMNLQSLYNSKLSERSMSLADVTHEVNLAWIYSDLRDQITWSTGNGRRCPDGCPFITYYAVHDDGRLSRHNTLSLTHGPAGSLSVRDAGMICSNLRKAFEDDPEVKIDLSHDLTGIKVTANIQL